MKQITIMADYGMGPYGWLNENPEEQPGLGPNIADRYGFPPDWNVSKELEADFADWITQFERDSFENPEMFPWEEFHRRGIELSRRLKREIGSAAHVRYVKPIEDLTNQTIRVVEIEIEPELEENIDS